MVPAKGLFQEFKQFVLRGNVIDLAIAVVIGAAFGDVIKALIADIITPIVAAIFGKPNFGALVFSIHKSRFLYGDFINVVITFVTIAAAVFFFVVRPVNILMARYKKQPEPDAPSKDCPECLSSIPAGARRCAFCTAAQPA